MRRVCRGKALNKLPVTLNLAEEQTRDSEIRLILEALKRLEDIPEWNTLMSESEDTKKLLAQWNLLTIKDKILCRKWLDSQRNIKWLQCVVPYSRREEVLRLCHTGLTRGHYGIRKTCHQIQRRACWKTWRLGCIR